MNDSILRLRELIAASGRIVFFGGAGVSTESGIPDFRSAHGLYAGAQGRSYEEMLSHGYFVRYPDAFWDFYRNVMLYPNAQPNDAHLALAKLEELGRLGAVVTQNIDGLHQAAGSRKVLELHGSVLKNRCMRCHHPYTLGQVLSGKGAPHCDECGGIIKPEVVLYGENLDDDILDESIAAIRSADLVIVGGTSLVVYPAAGLLHYRREGTPLVLINRQETSYDEEADLILRDNIADVLREAVSDNLALG